MDTATRTFAVGDLVTVDPSSFPASCTGVVYRITKAPVGARGVNYVAERADGVTGRGVRAPAALLRPHDPATEQTTPWGRVIEEVPIGPPPPPVGAVVVVKGVAKINPRHLYVVTADSRKPDCMRLSRLGGDPDGRYWPSIPTKYLTVVALSEMGEYL